MAEVLVQARLKKSELAALKTVVQLSDPLRPLPDDEREKLEAARAVMGRLVEVAEKALEAWPDQGPPDGREVGDARPD